MSFLSTRVPHNLQADLIVLLNHNVLGKREQDTQIWNPPLPPSSPNKAKIPQRAHSSLLPLMDFLLTHLIHCLVTRWVGIGVKLHL